MWTTRPRAILASLALLAFVAMPAALLAKKALSAPQFEAAASQPGLFRLLPSSVEHPDGVSELVLNAEVRNPNEVPLQLQRLDGVLRLDGRRTARVDMPLEVELEPGGTAIVTLRLKGYFGRLPALAELLDRSPDGTWIDYQVEGKVEARSPTMGESTFGPADLWEGRLQVNRWAGDR